MSEDLYIGLNKKQVQALLKGEQVGKRPYLESDHWEGAYNDTKRVHVFMISDAMEEDEPKAAFEWK